MNRAKETAASRTNHSEVDPAAQIYPDQVSLLYQNTLPAQIATLLTSSLAVLLMWGNIETTLVLGWFGAMLLISVLRLLLAQRYRRSSPAADSARFWARRYAIGATAAGLFWGLGGILIMLFGELDQLVLGAFILGGMATGAIGTSAPLRSAYFCFVLPMMVPFILALFLCGHRYHLVMGFYGLIFAGSLFFIYRLVHLSLRRSLILRFENTQILKELTAANEQLGESEERNRLLLESAGEGIFGISLDLEGECTFCNPAAAHLLGYRDPAELLGTNIHNLIHHNLYGTACLPGQCQIMRTMQTGEAQHVIDEVFWRSDGSSIPVEYRACPIHRGDQLIGTVITFVDVTLQRQAQAELARRDAILEAMSFSTGRLLVAASLKEGIGAVLEHLGQAMAVSRAYIFEKHLAADGQLLVSQRHEWVATGIPPQIYNPELQDFPLAEGGFGAWVSSFERGNIVAGPVRQFPPDVRALLEEQEICALLLMPIFSEQKWWGFIGFDDCKTERSWSPQEVKALKLAANLFGAAIKRQKSDEKLRQAAIVFANTHEGVVITDAAATIIAANTAFTKMTGYPELKLLGRNPRILKSGRHDEAFYRAMWDALLKTGIWQGEIWNRRMNGEIFPVWLTINAVRDATGAISHFVSLHSDISVIKRSQEEMEHLAHHDPLTQLPNRLLCTARIAQALERSRRSGNEVGLLYLDLDKFKQVNDTLGHSVGDELLIEAASRLTQVVRKQDTVARLGGDEFTVILEEMIHPDDAELVAQKILKSFAEPFLLAGEMVTITTSIGISRYPADGETIDALLKHADKAMYQAKQGGRNTFRHYAPPSQP